MKMTSGTLHFCLEFVIITFSIKTYTRPEAKVGKLAKYGSKALWKKLGPVKTMEQRDSLGMNLKCIKVLATGYTGAASTGPTKCP